MLTAYMGTTVSRFSFALCLVIHKQLFNHIYLTTLFNVNKAVNNILLDCDYGIRMSMKNKCLLEKAL